MPQRMPPRTAFQGKGGVDELPPPGDERREVLAARTDELAAKAEELGADAGEINPKAFRVENEIAQHMHPRTRHMMPPNANPEYEYCWVQRDPKGQYGNQWVYAKQDEGWDLVLASDPDAVGMNRMWHVEGVVVGDVILMRCSRGRFDELQQLQDEKTRRVEQNTYGELEARAQRHGVGIFDAGTPGELRNQIQARSGGGRMVVPVRPSHGDQALRTGNLPGMPAPRR